MSDFTVDCPYCEWPHDFTGDDWMDECIDDSQPHDIPCQKCGQEMVITVHAVYSLRAECKEESEP